MTNKTLENKNKSSLMEFVENIMDDYFCTLDGQPAKKLYDMVIKEAEKGLFKTVLRHAGGNQSLAAEYLGVARGTLRKRLVDYGFE